MIELILPFSTAIFVNLCSIGYSQGGLNDGYLLAFQLLSMAVAELVQILNVSNDSGKS